MTTAITKLTEKIYNFKTYTHTNERHLHTGFVARFLPLTKDISEETTATTIIKQHLPESVDSEMPNPKLSGYFGIINLNYPYILGLTPSVGSKSRRHY